MKQFIQSLLVVSIGILVMLQFELFGQSHFDRILSLTKDIETQAKLNAQLSLRNLLLSAEVRVLQDNPQALEAWARKDFGIIKQGEVFYQIIE